MKKVITYGTFELLHDRHINLLRRAKELGDYLMVSDILPISSARSYRKRTAMLT